jgi:hypothetical protein
MGLNDQSAGRVLKIFSDKKGNGRTKYVKMEMNKG